MSTRTALSDHLRETRSSPLLRYLVIGVTSFAIDFGTLYLLHGQVGWPLWIGTSAGFWLSFGFNFVANRFWTFQAHAHGSLGQIARYSILVLVNYGATVGLVTTFTWLGTGYLLAKTLSTASLTLTTFALYRSWVFRAPHLR